MDLVAGEGEGISILAGLRVAIAIAQLSLKSVANCWGLPIRVRGGFALAKTKCGEIECIRTEMMELKLEREMEMEMGASRLEAADGS